MGDLLGLPVDPVVTVSGDPFYTGLLHTTTRVEEYSLVVLTSVLYVVYSLLILFVTICSSTFFWFFPFFFVSCDFYFILIPYIVSKFQDFSSINDVYLNRIMFVVIFSSVWIFISSVFHCCVSFLFVLSIKNFILWGSLQNFLFYVNFTTF